MIAPITSRLLALVRTAASVGSGRAFSIALFVLSARHFVPEDNATFIYAITLPQLLIQLGTLGWLSLIRREVSRRDQMAPSLFKGFFLRSLQVPLLSVLTIALLLLLMPFATEQPDWHIYACAAGVTVVYTFSLILREYLAAFGSPAFGIWAAETVPFALTCGAILTLRPETVEEAILFFFLSVVVSSLIQLPALIRKVRPYFGSANPAYKTREWLEIGAFSLIGFGGRTMLDRLDTIVLATLAPAAQFAFYNSAQRVTGLLMLAPIVMLPVFSPHLSKAFSSNDFATLRRDMALQTFAVAACVVPMAALLTAYPEEVMRFLFGDDYGASSHILGMLVFAQVMFAFSLPWSNLMLMVNKERLYGYSHLLVLLVVLPFAIGLVDNWGAFAVALVYLVANATLFAFFIGVGTFILMFREPRTGEGS